MFCYKAVDEVQAVLTATGGRGADYILDQIVGLNFAAQLPMLAKCGTVIVYNTLGGFPAENTIQTLTDNFAKCCAVRAFSFHLYDDDPEGLRALRAEVFDLLAEGKIMPYIGAQFQQEEVVEAHRLLDAGTVGGAIVLRIPED